MFKPTTFFIHGTYLPVVTPILHLECKQGVSHPNEYTTQDILPKIALTLSALDPRQFPLDSFYLFGWSGRLSPKGRKEAAYELYKALKQYPHPVTLICHSHGCNVALNLAAIAQEQNDTDFYIDRLILLAGPVQEVTKEYIKSPIFRSIISLYSEGDMVQIIDPQGLQNENMPENLLDQPLFSQRLWPTQAHLTQARILFNGIDPWHLDFLLDVFIKFLPKIVAGLAKRKQWRSLTIDIDQTSGSLTFIQNNEQEKSV